MLTMCPIVLWQNSTFTPLSQMSPHWEYVIMLREMKANRNNGKIFLSVNCGLISTDNRQRSPMFLLG